MSKKFPASNAALWKAVQDVLDEQGFFFTPDSASGRIKTEPKVLGDQNAVAMFGATYSAVVQVKVDGSSVSYKARFNKKSNVVMGGELLEYPEKENEMRKEFFAALEARLRR
ncbi:MAG: hypothetical protein BWK76_05075 [Desulfobulbaceae bacterium A2]|nr:MAG: hypothetical protein BWK76_05075 [Desulfobulbaceae bacterium A2]